MKKSLFWIVVGGLSFWLLPITHYVVLDQNASWLESNALSLMGLTLLGVVTWIATKQFPKWGWVLVGIYILGPVSMMAPSLFFHAPSSPNIPGEHTWIILFCLFPPMTLWMGVLNGMIFSVLIATAVLPFLAVYLRHHRGSLGSSQTQ